MIFAVVESEPGTLEPAVVTGQRGVALSVLRLDGSRATVEVGSVVHAGITGDENAPPITYQFCPRWVEARLRSAGARRVAANPETVEGATYQSGDTKWTPGARRDRWKEQEHYRSAMRPGDQQWAPYEPNHVFGYHMVRSFIESYRRREVEPEAFFWCMIFAALTASESTKAAEANLAGFAKIIVGLRAQGYPLDARFGARGEQALITFEQFARPGQGFSHQRYDTLVRIFQVFPGIERFLRENRGLHDRALRDALLAQFETPGLGLTKLSFALECYGEDVACLDRWMLRALGVPAGRRAPAGKGAGPEKTRAWANRQIDAHRAWHREHPDAPKPKDFDPKRYFARVADRPWAPFTDGSYVLAEYGADRFAKKTEVALREYEWYEGLLRATPYYRAAVAEHAPNPLARSQWTMWEDILRRHPVEMTRMARATHSPLFYVIEGRAEARGVMAAAARERRARAALPRGAESKALPAPPAPRLVKNPTDAERVRSFVRSHGERDFEVAAWPGSTEWVWFVSRCPQTREWRATIFRFGKPTGHFVGGTFAETVDEVVKRSSAIVLATARHAGAFTHNPRRLDFGEVLTIPAREALPGYHVRYNGDERALITDVVKLDGDNYRFMLTMAVNGKLEHYAREFSGDYQLAVTRHDTPKWGPSRLNPLGATGGPRWAAANKNVEDAVSLLERTERSTEALLERRGENEELRAAQVSARQQLAAVEEVVREAVAIRSRLEQELFGRRKPVAEKSLPRPAT